MCEVLIDAGELGAVGNAAKFAKGLAAGDARERAASLCIHAKLGLHFSQFQCEFHAIEATAALREDLEFELRSPQGLFAAGDALFGFAQELGANARLAKGLQAFEVLFSVF